MPGRKTDEPATKNRSGQGDRRAHYVLRTQYSVLSTDINPARPCHGSVADRFFRTGLFVLSQFCDLVLGQGSAIEPNIGQRPGEVRQVAKANA